MKTQVDVKAFRCNNSDGVASRVQRGSTYSKVRWRLNEVQKELQEDGLMLVVQGRLAWGKVRENYGVYILLS